MKTKREASQLACSAFQFSRRRATSARSCSAAKAVFFMAKAHALKLSPNGGIAGLDVALLEKFFAEFFECDFRTLSYPFFQGVLAANEQGSSLAFSFGYGSLAMFSPVFANAISAALADQQSLRDFR
ncbi:hypothetical protein MLD52_11890 [Puniceicoccaceae bacterium K14]|nr:hypothetical protein [Puniceicoccaceae bacterium K14]